MTDPVLALLVVLVLALLLLAGAGAALPARSRQIIGLVGSSLCGLGVLLAVLSLTLTGADASLDLPIGPPNMSLRLACDPPSAYFLLLVFLVGTAVIAFAAEAEPKAEPATLAGPLVCIAGLALALMAADGMGLSLGIAMASLALWATGPAGRARSRQLAAGLLAAGAILSAAALTAPTTKAVGLAFLQAGIGGELRTILAFALVLLGAGILAGLVPLHRWSLRAHAVMPSRSSALLGGIMAPVGIYILLRASSVGPGVVVPVWWGLPLLAMGMASAVFGGWRAAREQALEAIVANLAMLPAGLAATGIGFTLVAAATDLPDLAALSLAAVFLLVLTQALCMTTLVLATGAVRLAAGARRLDQLGGLAHRMKLTTSAIAAALFCLVALPPASGFAALWLLVHAALTAPRAGSLLPQLLFVALIVGLALSSALATAAVVRLIGIAFLGRPRLPRSSAADEITRPARVVLLGLAALSLVVGILPGTVLNLLADPAITALSGNHLGARIGWLTLAPTLAAPGYAPLPLALLLAVAASGAVWIVRRQRREERDSPAWSGGFAAPPAWLPFGDPLTQGSGGGFVPDTPSFPLHRSMFRRPPRRLATTASGWTLLVVAVIALMSIAWLDTP